jgi:hypothetical protein
MLHQAKGIRRVWSMPIRNSIGLGGRHPLKRASGMQSFVPLVRLRKQTAEVKTSAHEEGEEVMPWNEHQICIGRLRADQVVLLTPRQMHLDHAQDSLDLGAVTINGRLDLLDMVLAIIVNNRTTEADGEQRTTQTYMTEPRFLTEVRALAAHLEMCPIPAMELLRRSRVRDSVICVVRLDQIVDIGTRLL